MYAAQPGGVPQKRFSPARSNNGQPFNWTRAEIAQFLLAQARQPPQELFGDEAKRALGFQHKVTGSEHLA